jgi:glutaredoxin
MNRVKVDGKNSKHRVLMYALSTCGWCKMTKSFLKENNVEYEYIDVDQCNQEDREKIQEDIRGRGGDLAYPTLIVDDKTLITGFVKNRIRDALEI